MKSIALSTALTFLTPTAESHNTPRSADIPPDPKFSQFLPETLSTVEQVLTSAVDPNTPQIYTTASPDTLTMADTTALAVAEACGLDLSDISDPDLLIEVTKGLPTTPAEQLAFRAVCREADHSTQWSDLLRLTEEAEWTNWAEYWAELAVILTEKYSNYMRIRADGCLLSIEFLDQAESALTPWQTALNAQACDVYLEAVLSQLESWDISQPSWYNPNMRFKLQLKISLLNKDIHSLYADNTTIAISPQSRVADLTSWLQKCLTVSDIEFYALFTRNISPQPGLLKPEEVPIAEWAHKMLEKHPELSIQLQEAGIERYRAPVIIANNFWLQENLKPTLADLQHLVGMMITGREKINDVRPYHKRHITLVGADEINEHYSCDSLRFANKCTTELLQTIAHDQGRTFHQWEWPDYHFDFPDSIGNGLANIHMAESDELEALKRRPQNELVIWSGHGKEYGVYMLDREQINQRLTQAFAESARQDQNLDTILYKVNELINDSGLDVITYDEMGRIGIWASHRKKTDLWLISACHSKGLSDYIMKYTEEILHEHYPRGRHNPPDIVVSSDFNQYSWSSPYSQYSDKMLENTWQWGDIGDGKVDPSEITLQDIILRGRRGKSTQRVATWVVDPVTKKGCYLYVE